MTEIHLNNKNGKSILNKLDTNINKCDIDCTIYNKKNMYSGKIVNIAQKGGKITVNFNDKTKIFKHTKLCINGHKSDNTKCVVNHQFGGELTQQQLLEKINNIVVEDIQEKQKTQTICE
jgi:hypothetical protein